MAIGFVLDTPGGTREWYEAILAGLGSGLHADPVPGQIFHAAGPYDGGWRVVDVWESREAFDRYLQEQLGAVMASVGGPQPNAPQFFDIHNVER